jgi:hypothetical protein
MNVDIYLLFNLDIPLDYMHKLSKYYYIPETRIKDLKLGGFVYLVDKLKRIKKIYYRGFLISLEGPNISFKGQNMKLEECIENYHLFYRPKSTKLSRALELASIIEKEQETDLN